MDNLYQFAIIFTLYCVLFCHYSLFSQENKSVTIKESIKKTAAHSNNNGGGSGVTMTILLPKVVKEIDLSQLHHKLAIKPLTPPLLDEKDKPVDVRINSRKIEIIPRLKLKYRETSKEKN